MKIIVGLLVVFANIRAQAGENLVCALIKKDQSSKISVTVDLANTERYYQKLWFS